MHASTEYVERMLAGLISLPGYIDDVAKRMIQLAALTGEGKTVVCRYGGIELHAQARSSVSQIRSYFERECRARLRHPVLRIV